MITAGRIRTIEATPSDHGENLQDCRMSDVLPYLPGFNPVTSEECQPGVQVVLTRGLYSKVAGNPNEMLRGEGIDMCYKLEFLTGPRGSLFFTQKGSHQTVLASHLSALGVDQTTQSTRVFGGDVVVDPSLHVRAIRFYHNKIYTDEEAKVRAQRVCLQIPSEQNGLILNPVVALTYNDGKGRQITFDINTLNINEQVEPYLLSI